MYNDLVDLQHEFKQSTLYILLVLIRGKREKTWLAHGLDEANNYKPQKNETTETDKL